MLTADAIITFSYFTVIGTNLTSDFLCFGCSSDKVMTQVQRSTDVMNMMSSGDVPRYMDAAIAAANGNANPPISLSAVISFQIFANVAINFITLQRWSDKFL